MSLDGCMNFLKQPSPIGFVQGHVIRIGLQQLHILIGGEVLRLTIQPVLRIRKAVSGGDAGQPPRIRFAEFLRFGAVFR